MMVERLHRQGGGGGQGHFQGFNVDVAIGHETITWLRPGTQGGTAAIPAVTEGDREKHLELWRWPADSEPHG
jgi:hypothetical protein